VSGPPADLDRFYDEAYRAPPEEAERLGRWRALGARAKAEHVVALCGRAGVRPARVADVGCGDGALLQELGERRFAPSMTGFEISDSAAALAGARPIPGVEGIETFNGATVPREAGAFDLGVISHVLEHVPDPVSGGVTPLGPPPAPDPASLLREVARVSRVVVLEVPLEANVSAERAGKRIDAEEIGHIQALDRAAVRRIVASAGLRVTEELADPLSREVHAFFATGPAARARAAVKAALRRAVFALAPTLAERLFTVHYAALCVPA